MRYCKLISSFALIILLSCCGSKSDMPIRIGYLQNDLHHLPLFVALDKGLFKAAGLDVTVAGIFKAGPEEMSAFAAGELDIGYVGQAPATAAYLNRVCDIKFLAQSNLEGSALVIGKDSVVKSISGLKQKSVAIPGHATIQDFLLNEALTHAGMSLSDVNTIVLKPPEMIQALNQGNIDAFIAWQPYPAMAQKDGSKILMSSAAIWKDHPCCVLIADTSFYMKHPEKIKVIIQVHHNACQFIQNHIEESVQIARKYTGMDGVILSHAIREMKYVSEINQNSALRFVNFLINMGYIKDKNQAQRIDSIFSQ